jgi:acyl-CoA thioester hydrolase
MTAMAEHRFQVRVYYEDTDFSGAVYHANYLKFCERARTEALRALGIHHHKLDTTFMVRRMECDFRSPAKIDDLLEIETTFVECRGARAEAVQRVMRGKEVLFVAKVTAAHVDSKGRPTRFPPAMANAFRQHTKNPPLTKP